MSAATATNQTVIEIPIADIANRFDVRRSLDEDRILMLAELYVAGADIPPIQVIELAQNGKYAFIDGRHRAAAKAFLDIATIQAIVVKNELDPCKLYANALQANWGGPKPPTREDITLTIVNMMELGAKDKEIATHLRFLPSASVRLYMSNARSVIHTRRIRRSLDLVAEGMTIADAAAKTFLDVQQVKDAVAGNKRKFSTDGKATALADFKRYLTRNLRSANSGIGQKIEGMMREVESGEIDAVVLIKAIDAWETHLKGSLHRVKDWGERARQIKT